MILKDELPHDPEAAHALIRQKLNEHTDELRAVMAENQKQNIELAQINRTLGDIEKNTKIIVQTDCFFRKFYKLVIVLGSISTALGGIIGLWHLYQGGAFG